ncbi:hypothetical protein C0995_010737 [Termitomyces sp. Mi166|nr:hypothetical protein C0995_010737 [Termitomyces sp. Mi166\
MPGQCQSTLPVEATVQYQDAFLSKASIESLSHNPSPEENAAHAKNLIATGRQYWKTRGNQGEAIWPPHVEIALLEGLARYQKDTWKPIRDHRCPMRNKFISEHIEKTTGVFRTPRQISSRIQHLRDTCQAQSIVDLITPSKPQAETTSTPTSPSQTPRRTPPKRQRNPYPRPSKSRRTSSHSPSHRVDNPSEENENFLIAMETQIVEPVPLRPLVPPPILTAPLSYFLPQANSSLSGPETPQSPTLDSDFAPLQDATDSPYSPILRCGSPIRCGLAPSYNIDVLLDDTTSSVPLIPLSALDNLEPLQISLGCHQNSLAYDSFSLDTVVQLVSPCPLLTQSVLSLFVSGCQTSIHTEATTLLCNSVPLCGTDWFYMVSLLPNFWNTLSDVTDPGDYIIEQTILPLRTEDRLTNEMNLYAGTQDEPSKITIYYRFRSTWLSSLHLDARAYPALQNSSVWHGTSFPCSNRLMSSSDPSSVHQPTLRFPSEQDAQPSGVESHDYVLS